METAYLEASFCRGESRSDLILEGTLSEYESIWASLSAAPDKTVGEHCKPWTPDEDWILWTMWKRKRQPDTAKALHRGIQSCRMRYDELKRQDGPNGDRPEWMK